MIKTYSVGRYVVTVNRGSGGDYSHHTIDGSPAERSTLGRPGRQFKHVISVISQETQLTSPATASAAAEQTAVMLAGWPCRPRQPSGCMVVWSLTVVS